jgi:hypothetical protein
MTHTSCVQHSLGFDDISNFFPSKQTYQILILVKLDIANHFKMNLTLQSF